MSSVKIVDVVDSTNVETLTNQPTNPSVKPSNHMVTPADPLQTSFVGVTINSGLDHKNYSNYT